MHWIGTHIPLWEWALLPKPTFSPSPSALGRHIHLRQQENYAQCTHVQLYYNGLAHVPSKVPSVTARKEQTSPRNHILDGDPYPSMGMGTFEGTCASPL